MSCSRIADVLGNSLPSAFATICDRRYGGPIELRRLGNVDASAPTLVFQLECPSFAPVEACFTVRHVGGNMYEVKGQMDNEDAESFSYCLSEDAPVLVPKAPRLAQEIATYLLDAFERQLGSEVLRTALSSPAKPMPTAKPRSLTRERPHSTKEEPPGNTSSGTEQRSNVKSKHRAN